MLEFLKYGSDKPEFIVVMLHGYGSNKEDLITLAPELSMNKKKILFVSVNAPLSFEGSIGDNQRQWFSLIDRSFQAISKGLNSAERHLLNFIKYLLDNYNIKENNLCLLGFSQGSMLSLHMILKGLINPRGAIIYSGRIFQDKSYNATSAKILMIHGEEDDIVTLSDMLRSFDYMLAKGIDVKKHISRYLGHGIDKSGITLGKSFLEEIFI